MTLTTGNILTYASNTWPWAEIATAPDGSFYAIMDNNNAARGISVVKYNPTTTLWDNVASFDPADAGVDAFSDDLDIAISADGNLHVVFKHSINPGVTSTRGVMYGEFDGTNWAFKAIEQASTSNGGINMDDPRVMVDSNGDVHITYNYTEYLGTGQPRTEAIRYATDAGESNFTVETPFSWSGVTGSGINEVHDPIVLEGPSGAVHLMYRYEDNFNGSGNLYYQERSSTGTWDSTPTRVDGTPGAQNPNYYAHFTTDAADAVKVYYIIPGENSYAGTLNLYSNASGSFQSTQEFVGTSNFYDVKGYEVANGVEYLHVTLLDDPDTFATSSYIYSRPLGTTDWKQEVAVGYGGADTDFAMNSNGDFMVILSDSLGSGPNDSGNSVRFQTSRLESDTTAPDAPSAPDMSASSDSGKSNSDNITNDSSPTFTGTAEAGAVVELFYADTMSLGTTTADASGNWSLTPTTVPNGVLSITAKATDAAGNTSAASAALSVTMDYGPPAAPIIATITDDTGAFSNDFVTNDTTLTIGGTAEAGATVTISNGSSVIGSAVANGSGQWTSSHTFAAGTFTLSATATDAAGNTSSASSPRTLTVDTTQPVIFGPPDLTNASDTGASQTDNVTSDTTPTFTGLAEANARVELFYNGTISVGTTTADSAGNWEITASTLPVGPHSITAVATDLAGNASQISPVLSMTIDPTAPSAPSVPNMTAATDSGVSSTDNITADTTPTFTGIAEANSTVELFYGSGTSLGKTTADGSGNWSITATTIPSGTQSITAKATDQAGNTSPASAPLSVTIDNARPDAPAITAISDDAGDSPSDFITNDTTLTISGTAEAGASVTVFQGAATLGTVVANGAGQWTLAHTFAEGNHTLTALARDVAGNLSDVSAPQALTIDATAPDASKPNLTGPSDSGADGSDDITNETTPTFNGTTDPGSKVELFADGATSLGFTTADENGIWRVTSSTLADGTYDVTAVITDIAGNVSPASPALTVVIDTTAPDAPSTPDMTAATDSGLSDTDNATNIATPTFTGTAEANATVTLYADGTNALGSTVADASGNWSITATTIASGTHDITAQVVDAAGNVSESSAALSVSIDTGSVSAPTVDGMSSDTGSAANDGVTSDQTLVFTGTAEAGATVTVLLDGDAIGTTTADGSGDWSFDYTGTTIVAGAYTVTARASDVAGNVSPDSAGFAVVVDNIAPLLSDIDLVDASDDGSSNLDNRTSDTTPTFAYTAEAGALVEIDFGDGNGYQAAAAGTGAVQTATLADAYATEGPKIVQLRATDLAGNQSTKALGVIINKKPTNITINNSTIAENSAAGVVIGALAVLDPTPGDSHTLSLVSNPDGLFALDGNTLVVGPNADLDFEAGATRTIDVKATDSIGGEIVVSIDVTLTDMIDVIGGTTADDVLAVSAAAEAITLGDGDDTVATVLSNFDDDVFMDFSLGDTLVFTDIALDRSRISFTGNNPTTVSIDRDGDDTADVIFTIDNALNGGEMLVAARDGQTTITYENYFPTLTDGVAIALSDIQTIDNQKFLMGSADLGFRVTIDSTKMNARYDNALGVYEVDEIGNIVDVRILVDNATTSTGESVEITGVESGHQLGFFIVSDGADELGDFADADTFSFIDSDGNAANIDDGADIMLAVNGGATDLVILHALNAGLNADGVQHAVSGVNAGGMGITIGFEDVVGGGDLDYQDVVFSVDTFSIL